MPVQPEKLQALAQIITDYREGEIPRPDAAHVDRWVSQFDEPVRVSLLDEVTHVFGKTYAPKLGVQRFLGNLVQSQKLTGGNPAEFWKNAKFLDIQTRGSSQREFLALFAVPLKEQLGLELAQCGANPNCFVYIDDGIFTGMTLIESLSRWLTEAAPAKAILHAIVIAGHVGGKHYAETQLRKKAAELKKTIEFHWWAPSGIEDRRININISDVLRPTALPEDDLTKKYAQSLGFPVV